MRRSAWLAAGLVVAVLGVAAGLACSDSGSSGQQNGSAAASPSPAPAGPLTTAAYSDATRKIASDYTIEFRKMGTLVSNPSFESMTWQRNLSDVVAAIKAIGARMRALEPPACLTDVHSLQVQAASSYDQMADLLAAGVQNADDDALAQSAQLLNEGNDEITQATTLLSSTHC
jgi:hypothetical protein